MRIRYVAALISAALLVSCGGDDGSNNADEFEGDERDVVSVVDAFADAGRDGDGGKVCDEIFATALAKNVERESRQDCAAEVEENLPEDEYELEVDDVNVKGKGATVSVTDQDDNQSVLHMVKVGGGWRILRVTPG
jgi:hypothetical protein